MIIRYILTFKYYLSLLKVIILYGYEELESAAFQGRALSLLIIIHYFFEGTLFIGCKFLFRVWPGYQNMSVSNLQLRISLNVNKHLHVFQYQQVLFYHL